LVMIASASNIFGRGLGSIILKNILDEYPHIFQLSKTPDELITMVEKVDSISTKRAKLFVENIPKFIDFMNRAKLNYKLKEVQEKPVISKTSVLYKKNIVMTGPRDTDLKEKIIKMGGKLSSTVNKNTFVVIVETKDIQNSKTETALQEKIPLLTYSEFKSKYL